MTRDAITDKLKVAVRRAFEVGRAQGKGTGGGRPDAETLASCLQYAEALVLPVVEAAIEQGVEEAYAATRRTEAS